LTQTEKVYIQENIELCEIFKEVEKSAAGVKTTTATGKILEGSGLTVTSDGLMVTLAELVPFNSSYSFFVGKDQVSYHILKRDKEENLALVKISDSALNTVVFSNKEDLKIGERIFLVGNVFLQGKPSRIIEEGIIRFIGQDFIETNIIGNPGLAGSPLFNIKGEAIGLSVINPEGRIEAIPIYKIKEFAGV
jgi:S1-C subfamily serine protease